MTTYYLFLFVFYILTIGIGAYLAIASRQAYDRPTKYSMVIIGTIFVLIGCTGLIVH